MRFIGYTRVSDKEQVKTGFSIEAQQETITAWCSEQGHTLVRVVAEPGRSGSKPSQQTRPAFEQAVNLVLAGISDGLVVKWMDRFARNVEDFLRIRSRFYQAGKYLVSINEPLLNGDPTDPVARYISVAIMNAYQLQAELTGVKSAQGRDRRAKSGKYPGTLPLGYIRHNGEIIPSDQAGVIQNAFTEFATGRWTLDSWVKEAARRGYTTKRGKLLNKSAWHRMLRNRFYAGYYVWHGDEFAGDFSALVEESLFDEVQRILDDRSTGESRRKRFWLLSGLLWSEVHSRVMTGCLIRGRYSYYRAMSPGMTDHNVPADEIEARLVEELKNIMWTGQRTYFIPEHWRLAFRVANTMQAVYNCLESEKDKQELLRMIFLGRGIHVTASGRIDKVDLFPDFEYIF